MVIKGRFDQKGKNTQPSQTSSVEAWSAEQRRAYGYILQIYGTLVGAGLYTDSCGDEGAESKGGAGAWMRRRGSCEKTPRVLMTITFDKGQWEFRYKRIYARMADLDQLAVRAHAEIARLEKRDLRPLMGDFSPGSNQQRHLRSL